MYMHESTIGIEATLPPVADDNTLAAPPPSAEHEIEDICDEVVDRNDVEESSIWSEEA